MFKIGSLFVAITFMVMTTSCSHEDLTPITPYPSKPQLSNVHNANCVIVDIDKPEKCYGIDITRANVFWSNIEVGDVANLIDSSTEWTAEVIWQDIDRRAINFCDADGNVVTGDSFNGKGKKPFYIKAVTNNAGNVIVGIKKKGAGTDAYLWSWHLWFTEEPKEIAGFMDRNLGATSSNPSDGIKTYGLYYQFGRKDPFVGEFETYDINGLKIKREVTIVKDEVSFGKAVNTPDILYLCSGSQSQDWASINPYKERIWNNINDSEGKSLFDPSPEGWRLPEVGMFNKINDSNFSYRVDNKGITFKDNWFPAAGYRSSIDGKLRSVGYNGNYWSATPYSTSDCGCYLFFDAKFCRQHTMYDRSGGHSVRLVCE